MYIPTLYVSVPLSVCGSCLYVPILCAHMSASVCPCCTMSPFCVQICLWVSGVCIHVPTLCLVCLWVSGVACILLQGQHLTECLVVAHLSNAMCLHFWMSVVVTHMSPNCVHSYLLSGCCLPELSVSWLPWNIYLPLLSHAPLNAQIGYLVHGSIAVYGVMVLGLKLPVNKWQSNVGDGLGLWAGPPELLSACTPESGHFFSIIFLLSQTLSSGFQFYSHGWAQVGSIRRSCV